MGDHETDVHGIRIVVDLFSTPYMKGSQIDFVDALMGGGFAIENPNVVASCGCGSSFQAKDDVEGDEASHADGCGSGCSH